MINPSICFVALNAYGLLSGRDDIRHIGGAERQQVLIARELVRSGYSVSFVVLDHGQPDALEIAGIHLYKAYRPDAGLPVARFVYPRLIHLWAAMRRANADIYYQRGAEAETGLVAAHCRRHGRRFVFAIAHDTNCDGALPFLDGLIERVLCRYGLRRAKAVIAQTCQQQRLMQAGFGIETFLVRSCFPDIPPAAAARAVAAGPRRVLWVGRLSPEKRPEWLISLARDVPACQFDVVGQCNVDSPYGRVLADQLSSLPNVTCHGYVPHHRMDNYYSRAAALLCTSQSEGFPNVFLEAWACETPVISAVDPDGLIEQYGLGQVGADYAALKACLLDMLAGRVDWENYGLNGRHYVTEHHSTAAAVARLKKIFDACMNSRGAPSAANQFCTPTASVSQNVAGSAPMPSAPEEIK